MADNENYIENIQFGEDEEIYPIRDAEAHEEIDTNKEEIDSEIEKIKEDYVEKEGGELADTIVTYEDEETTVSSFTDFISNFISGSKVAKWFKDFRAGVEYILHVGSLVNNCVTDNSQLPLSAAQGKVLMDELTSVKSDLTELEGNLNGIKIYHLNLNAGNTYTFTVGNAGYGLVIGYFVSNFIVGLRSGTAINIVAPNTDYIQISGTASEYTIVNNHATDTERLFIFAPI